MKNENKIGSKEMDIYKEQTKIVCTIKYITYQRIAFFPILTHQMDINSILLGYKAANETDLSYEKRVSRQPHNNYDRLCG